MVDFIHILFSSSDPLPLLGWSTLYFFVIYIGAASLALALALLVNRRIEVKPVTNAQLRREILQSMRSILLFGSGMLVPWGMLHLGWVNISSSGDTARILIEIIALILWNDLHFYLVHRLLHTYFRKWHLSHHKSVVASPFSSYSMGVNEALLLGSVMPIAMLAHDFSIIPLFMLPIWSIMINALAHSNCDLFPQAKENSLLAFIRHHQAHHSQYHGNYSFFFSQLDRWMHSDQSTTQSNPARKGRA